MVDEIMWTGNLGTAILRVQQSGSSPMTDEQLLQSGLERMPKEGDVAGSGSPENAVQTFLEFSLEQIEAMIDLVRGDLDK